MGVCVKLTFPFIFRDVGQMLLGLRDTPIKFMH